MHLLLLAIPLGAVLPSPATPLGATVPSPTAPLLAALQPLGFAGFEANAAQRRDIAKLLDELKSANPNAAPATDLDGDWELIYSDAPDIVGLANSGPLVQLARVGQQIDASAGTIANVIEYAPQSWLPLDAVGAGNDVLQQRVLLSYTVDTDGRRCKLNIAGLSLGARRLLGVSLAAAPPLTVRGVLELPFGDFECLYNDGDVRVIRTAQGFYGVNRRMAGGDGWDETGRNK